MQTARSGPPWCFRSSWPSPSSPNRDTLTPLTRLFGTPPRETFIETTVPVRWLSNSPPSLSLFTDTPPARDLSERTAALADFSLTRKLTGIPPFLVAKRDHRRSRICAASTASDVSRPILQPCFVFKAVPKAEYRSRRSLLSPTRTP